MAKVAGEEGVILSMENLNRFEGPLINTMDQAPKVLRRVDSPNLKITADVFHMNIEENGIWPAALAGGSNIAQFHLGEANRKLAPRSTGTSSSAHSGM